MIPYDVYVLAGQRSIPTVNSFLSQFGGSMKESASDYSLPQYADAPNFVFHTASVLLEYLVDHPNEPYTVYYRTDDFCEPLQNAILSFTTDGHLIVGLTVHAQSPLELGKYLERLAIAVDGKL